MTVPPRCIGLPPTKAHDRLPQDRHRAQARGRRVLADQPLNLPGPSTRKRKREDSSDVEIIEKPFVKRKVDQKIKVKKESSPPAVIVLSSDADN
jgi:hypothetical protein